MSYHLILSTLVLGMLSPLILALDAPREVNGTFRLSWDNDAFSSSDDHYTNGVQIGWVSGYLREYDQPGAPVPGFIGRPLTALPLVNRDGRQRFISYSFSQRLFTPNDITDPDLIENDMPYSGMLFGTMTAGAQDEHQMDAWSLTLGVVGPSALGEETQREVHSLIASEDPAGWEHQLNNEILLNLWYEHRRRLAQWGDRDGASGDVMLQAGGALGNLIGMGTAGIGIRWGMHLPDDYAAPPQFFGEETVGSRPWSTRYQSSVHVFLHANASVFSNAIFWDGNTFTDSHSIDYDPWIGRVYAGVRFHIGSFGGTLSYAATTIPWDNPDDKSYQLYGRIALGWTY